MNHPTIQFDHVSRSFGNQVALDDVSFSVPEGQVFALLGENGSGKTTSIKTMLGMCRPDAGKATVMGMDPISQCVEIRRTVGYVPEEYSLYNWMTVKEVGWFTAGFYPAGYQTEYLRLAERFGLPLDKKLSKLSKGMKAKVVLSVAMSHQPPLLILDEPTSGLDTLVRREFLESMVDLTATGQTVFLSSHQIPEVERVADIVAIMKQGKLLLVEELAQLKNTCREVIVTFDHEPDLTAIPGDVVNHTLRGRQCACLIRTDDEAAYERLSEKPGICAVDVRRPSLEEIFIGLIRGHTLPANAPHSSNDSTVASSTEAVR